MLQNRRVLVTGGTTGIGRAIVMWLAREGANVVTCGRDPDTLADALASFDGLPGRVHGCPADLGTVEGITRIFDEVETKLGGLDILISNAALGAQPIDAMEDDDWRYVVDVNLKGAMACARGALERFDDAGGQIVIIGSISAAIHAPGESVYSATKAGIQAFAETLRKEVADRNIRVSVIQPGSVDTDMQECSDDEKRAAVDRQQMLPATEVAEAIGFVLTRPAGTDIVNLRIEPRLQKTS